MDKGAGTGGFLTDQDSFLGDLPQTLPMIFWAIPIPVFFPEGSSDPDACSDRVGLEAGSCSNPGDEGGGVFSLSMIKDGSYFSSSDTSSSTSVRD